MDPKENDKQDVVRDHEYDGIQEYDNRLPNWWIGTFVVTAVFALYYWGTRHMYHTVPDSRAAFTQEMADLRKAQEPKASAGAESEQDLAAFLKDPANLKAGKDLFHTNCVACHGPDGGGVIGPNLTDRYWLHGGKPEQVIQTITNGVPEKGMVPWKGTLTQAQIRQAAAYVLSLRDTKPANPKAPQGELEP